MMSWVLFLSRWKPYNFQKDYATPSITQEWLANCFHDYIILNFWLPSSPDLNQLGYYVWGVVERNVNKYPQNTKNSLKAIIVRVIDYIDEDHLMCPCQRCQWKGWRFYWKSVVYVPILFYLIQMCCYLSFIVLKNLLHLLKHCIELNV